MRDILRSNLTKRSDPNAMEAKAADQTGRTWHQAVRKVSSRCCEENR